MLNQSKISKFLEKQLLKSILPHVCCNSEWARWVSQLARTTAVVFQGKNGKQKKPKCPICQRGYDNYLLLVFHLQLFHQQDVHITKYQFFQETLTISIKRNLQRQVRSLYVRDQTHEFHLLFSLKERQNRISESILAKFYKKQSTHKMKYFHSVDIFRFAEESDEQEQDPYGNIEQQLEQIKISEFTDINENDKQFFIKWNEAVHKAKKAYVYIGEEAMRELLQAFARDAKKNGLKRSNLLMHGFTLWSSGKISSNQVLIFLDAYDRAV